MTDRLLQVDTNFSDTDLTRIIYDGYQWWLNDQQLKVLRLSIDVALNLREASEENDLNQFCEL